MLDFLLHKAEMTLFTAARAGDAAKVRDQLARKVALLGVSVTPAVHKKHPELEEGATALHLASRYGHAEVVEVLLPLKPDVNAATASGATALQFAAAGDHADIVAMLLDHKADAGKADLRGSTPLLEAASHGFDDVVRLLLSHSAPVEPRNKENLTPLHVATYCGSLDTVKLLLQAHADPNVQDDRGRTPLHLAVVACEPAPNHSAVSAELIAVLIQYLLELGADPNLQDVNGESAYDLLMSLSGQSKLAAHRGLIDGFRAHGAQPHQGGPAAPAAVNNSSLPGVAAAKSAIQPGVKAGTAAGVKPGTTSATASGVNPGVQAPAPAAATSSATRSAVGPGKPPVRATGANGMPLPEDRVSWGTAPIALGERSVTIGRDADCDVRYLSRTLSRRHAKIERTGKGFVISDQGSRNGILIDQVRVTGPTLLKPNQVVELGAYEFRFDGFRLIPIHGELSPEQLAAELKRNDPNAPPGKGTTLSPSQTNAGGGGILGAFKR